MAERIVVIEKECEHGQLDRHRYPEPPPGGYLPGDLDLSRVCPGGTRRVLDPGSYVLVEKVDGEWPEWAQNHPEQFTYGDGSDVSWAEILDALAGGEG